MLGLCGIFLLVFCCFLRVAPGNSEVYSSAADMMEVFKLERELVGIMDNFAGKLQKKLDKINSYLEEFEEVLQERRTSSSEEELAERIATNPLHAYKMMKRFNVDWKTLEQDLETHDWEEVEFMLKKKRLGTVIPREEDLHGAAQALIRLQDVYELDIRDLSKGDLGIARERVLTKASLSAQDCLFMGKHCFNSGALARSLEWFEEAWVMAGSERNQSSLRQDQVQQFLDHAAKAHDVRVLNGERGPELFPKPVYDESPFDQRTKMVQETKERFKENITSLVKVDQFDVPRFNALCRGEELRDPKYVAKLKCYQKTMSNPYYKLAPIKEEIIHINPSIWMYHDIASPLERRGIIQTAGPFMMRSQVQGQSNGPGSVVSNTRTSKTGWLQDSFHPAITSLNRRVSDITGLNTDTFQDESELLQVANYINGGHYSPHHDYIQKEKDSSFMIYKDESIFVGDRIATWMFYLNDVASGGRTVFPRIGAGIPPVAGSAVFWYNLFPSGDADQLTLHGACPVLYGTKWVSNKWIREGAQVFRRKCDLKRQFKHDYE